ncbi:MAG: 23S rRNA (uracil(1939)-C(5))-methyltransferase RlmD, partial [Clostridiales bacterium]|nr:23S rRNA (uracil(1939)-C(5))-methyltransferase RlmD [Candidatus Coliplasma equi]
LGIFNEKTLRGFLRHVLIRKGKFTGEIMVVLVTGTVEFPKKNDFLKMLLGAHPNITTVVQNINNSFTAMVLGERNITLYGDGFIRDTLCGLTFRISPNSFYQVNPVMAEKLYTLAVEGLSLTGKETVIDAYCGTGTIGLIAAKKAKEVLGVEQNASAVKDAEANARENDIKNEKFFRADSGEFMVSLAEEGIKVDAVITDPPRAGCDLPFLRSLIKLSPEKVAYVSCNPETLARDLGFLTRNGYKVKSVTPVDMFPHTDHVETVVLMSRVNK